VLSDAGDAPGNPAIGADALQLIGETVLLNPQAIVSTLINDITDVDEDVYLFLEDYHLITRPEIHDAVAFFLKHAPSHAHVVLTTRTEPPLPLASLRAQNQLLEIDASSLRFDLQETQAFLERENAARLESADLMILHSRTEGWPAALRILVSTSASATDLTQHLRKLSALHRPIDAYLAEMIDGLPADLVSFMLRTAVLAKLSIPLCEAVTGAPSAGALLASIERRQLLIALDHEGEWFRYHPILVEYLKRRLEAEIAAEVPDLNRRAAHWYASQELWTEAVQHALASGDTEQALGWIERCAMDLVKKGDLLTLLAWQRLFPPEVMKRQPAVRLAIAWGLALATRAKDALQMVADIEHDLDPSTSVASEQLTNECRLIRAVALSLRDEGGGTAARRAVLEQSERPVDSQRCGKHCCILPAEKWRS
jgi:LuxR family maltose regulon positive regulatory protein